MAERIEELRLEISMREAELASLKAELAAAEKDAVDQNKSDWKWPLRPHEYDRYSRQMIVPNFGVEGQSGAAGHHYFV